MQMAPTGRYLSQAASKENSMTERNPKRLVPKSEPVKTTSPWKSAIKKALEPKKSTKGWPDSQQDSYKEASPKVRFLCKIGLWTANLEPSQPSLRHAEVSMIRNRDREKLVQSIVYFAHNTKYLGKVKLFKLLYLMDFRHFQETGRSVTGLDYSAWKCGPVPVTVYQEWEDPDNDFKDAIKIEQKLVITFVRKSVSARVKFDDSHFTKRELRIMNELATKYYDARSPKMIDVTHEQNGAWAKTWENGKGQNKTIPYESGIPDNYPHRSAILKEASEYEAMRAQAC